MINIPIFIVAKGCDSKKAELTKTLLPYAFDYINQNEILSQTWVISDDDEIISLSKELGFNNIYKEKCKHCPICHIDFVGIYHCIIDNKIDCEWFLNVRLDQPFKGFKLILDLIRAIDDKYDLVCSASYIRDRSMFFVDENDKFIENVDRRLSNYCPTVKMIDSSIYAYKTKVFIEDVKSGHFDVVSWTHKMKTVINNAMFINIFEAEQIKQLDKAQEIFIRVHNHTSAPSMS